MVRLGIGGRLFLAHLVLSAILLATIELVLPSMLRAELERQLDGRLHLAAAALAAQLREGDRPALAAAQVARATDFRMSVIGTDGLLLADSAIPPERLQSAGPHDDRAEVRTARTGGIGRGERQSSTTEIETRYVALTAPDGTVVRAAKDVAFLHRSIAAARRATLLAAALGVVVAALLGGAAALVAGRSVRQLQQAARRMAAGDLGDLAVPRGPGELADVAVALERLAGQLAQQFARLTAERDLLEAVLAAMEEAVLVLRTDGRLLHANATARHLLALPDTAHEQPLVEAVRLPAVLDAIRAAAGGRASHLELTLDGPPRRELVGRAAPLPRQTDAAVVLVLRDVTELRRLEGMRRDFVANASHELRTPVAAIRGYAESLAAGALDDRATAERFVSGLARQAERLSVLVDALLDLSRVESGGLRLVPEAVDAAGATTRLVESVRDRAVRKGLDIGFDSPEGDLRARVDPRALEMILGNLLDNAIKYTPTGGAVRVRVGAGDGTVRFEVIDTGPGIEPQHQQRIFERFYRVDAGRSREVGGVGLGLSIARHLAQQSGGELGVDSRVGAGSRFWLELPAA